MPGIKKKSSKSPRGRNWCFTINNPPKQWKSEMTVLEHSPEFRYLVSQLEKAPTTGTEHIQGYIQFNKQLRLAGLKRLHPTAHWEVARGSLEQNQTYCTKDDSAVGNDVYEAGTPKQQGKRTDIEEAVKRAAQGDRIKDIVNDTPHMVRYRKALYDHATECRLDIRRPTTLRVEVHWGESRVGKTYSIMNKGSVFKPIKGSSGHWWWDGYLGETRILFDDFYGDMKWTTLMKMLDPTQPFRGDIKGQMPVQIVADEYYFTSNVHPHNWYDWTKTNMKEEALMARIHYIKQYSRQGTWQAPKPLEEHYKVKSDYTQVLEPAVHDIFKKKNENEEKSEETDEPVPPNHSFDWSTEVDKDGFCFSD